MPFTKPSGFSATDFKLPICTSMKSWAHLVLMLKTCLMGPFLEVYKIFTYIHGTFQNPKCDTSVWLIIVAFQKMINSITHLKLSKVYPRVVNCPSLVPEWKCSSWIEWKTNLVMDTWDALVFLVVRLTVMKWMTLS